MYPNASVPLSIAVVGGGIGGLAISILLAQAGHQVTNFENKDESFEDQNPGSLCLTWNSVRWLQAMGLEHELAHIGDTSHDTLMMKYDTGELLRSLHRDLPLVLLTFASEEIIKVR